jgi:hypothetical protein
MNLRNCNRHFINGNSQQSMLGCICWWGVPHFGGSIQTKAKCYYADRSRDSVVGIATGYGFDDQGVGVRVPVRPRIFSSPRHPDWPWGPPNLSNGYQGLFPRGVKRQGGEADHSSPASGEVKKTWIYISTPHTPSWRSA